MRIHYFTPYFPPESEAAAIRSYWFIRSLKEVGHEVVLLSSQNFHMKLASNKAPFIQRLLAEHLMGIELFVKIFFSKSDRVILSSPPFFTVLWGAFACLLRGKKYLLDVRDLYPEVFFEMNLVKEASALGKFIKAITKILYLKADQTMTVTKGLIQAIEAYGAKNVHLIMNGYDSELFMSDSTIEKFKKFTLVFHGNLGKVQNIQTLLALAQRLEEHANIEIVIAGEGPKAKEIIAAQRKNIKYLGNIPYTEIPLLLKRSHLGLSFRTDDKIGKESFPVKVFEYLGSGLPVIMTPKGEAGDIVENLSAGFAFENFELEKMVEKILLLASGSLPFHPGPSWEFSRQRQAKKILSLVNR